MSKLDNVKLRLVDTFSSVQDMFAWYKTLDPTKDVMGFDTETSSADDMFKPNFRLRTVQIGDREFGWTVPWEGFGGFIMELLRDWEMRHGMFVAHNLSYDAKVMKRYAGWTVPWHLFHDTFVLARLAYPDELAGLKALTDKYVDPRASDGQVDLKKAFKENNWDWDTVPINFHAYWFYAALDPVLAVLLLDHFKPTIEKYHKAYDMEFSVVRVCSEIESRGMRIDLDYVNTKHSEYSMKIREGEQYVEDRWKINLGSNPEVAQMFIDLGAEFSFFTPKGAPSVNADQMELFGESDNPEVREVAQKILGIRDLKKIDGYFNNFLEMHIDGWLYPQIKTMEAITHRMSITKPALQTLPSDNPEVRNAFLADTDDEVILSCDYSSQELRMSAHFSNEAGLVEAFRKADEEGADVFIETGKVIFDDPTLTKANAGSKRGMVKTFFYASGYGAGIDKMASQLNISNSEMQEVADLIDKSYPGIKEFSRSVIAKGEAISQTGKKPYAELEDGRRIPTYPRKEYKLVNYMFQGTAAIMTKRALLRLDAMGLSKYIKIPIHDELLFSIHRDMIDELALEIEHGMSFYTEYSLPFPSEPEIDGRRWGNAYCDVLSDVVDIRDLFSSKNNIETKYVKTNSEDKYLWECSNGHEWEKGIHDMMVYPECNECMESELFV